MSKDKLSVIVPLGILALILLSFWAVFSALKVGRDLERNLSKLENPVSSPASTKSTKVVVHGPDELTQEFRFEGRTYTAVRIKLRPSAEAGKIDHQALQLRAQACLDHCLWGFQQAIVNGDVYVALFRLISSDEQKWADQVTAEMVAPSVTIENPLPSTQAK